MPTPEQTRKERIKKLLEWANEQGTNLEIVDPLVVKSQEMFPMVSNQTARGYAEAVLRIMKWEKRREDTEHSHRV